jgi:hypothetical protein
MTQASIPANARWRAKKLDHFSQEGGPLRGHGDSQWAPGGSYYLVDFVYDVVQLVRQARLTGLGA